MIKKFALFGPVVMVGLLASTSSAAAVSPEQQAAINESLARIAELDLEQWTYTRTTTSSDEHTVDRHEPQRPGAEHWQLLRVENREPTEEDWADYRDKRSDHSEPDEDRLTIGDLQRMVVMSSVEMESDENAVETYAFRLRSPNGKKKSTFRNLRGTLAITRRNGRYEPVRARVWAVEPIYPALGVRLTEFDLGIDFVPVEDALVPGAMQFGIAGRAFLIKELEEQVTVLLTDHQRHKGGDGLAMP